MRDESFANRSENVADMMNSTLDTAGHRLCCLRARSRSPNKLKPLSFEQTCLNGRCGMPVVHFLADFVRFLLCKYPAKTTITSGRRSRTGYSVPSPSESVYPKSPSPNLGNAPIGVAWPSLIYGTFLWAQRATSPCTKITEARFKMVSDSPTTSVEPAVKDLLQDIESRISKTQLGPNRWYLIALTALTGGGSPHLADQIYLYLTQKPEYSESASRQALVRRLREDLVKSVSIVGVCRPIEAIVAIAKVEREGDRDYSCSREGWACDDANYERGMAWLKQVYQRNISLNLGLFTAHKDFDWISKNITYGLYLSDRQVLDDIETELVVVSGIMIQNLRLETWWHIRGTRRQGVSKEDMQVVYDCIVKLAKFMEVKLDRVPTVDEVEPDV